MFSLLLLVFQSLCVFKDCGVISAAFTRHVAGPLVALEVKLASSLSDVLGRLPLLEIPNLLLSIFTQDVHA